MGHFFSLYVDAHYFIIMLKKVNFYLQIEIHFIILRKEYKQEASNKRCKTNQLILILKGINELR